MGNAEDFKATGNRRAAFVMGGKCRDGCLKRLNVLFAGPFISGFKVKFPVHREGYPAIVQTADFAGHTA